MIFYEMMIVSTVHSVSKIGKRIARGTAGVSTVMSIYSVGADMKAGNYKKAVARGAFAITTAFSTGIPVVGPGVAMGLSTIDALYGEQMYQWVEDNFTF